MNPKEALRQKCSNCFLVKPLEEFYRKLERHQSRCKACNAEVVRGYQYRRKARLIKERWDQIYGRLKNSL